MKGWKEADFTIPKSVGGMKLALRVLASIEKDARRRSDDRLASDALHVIVQVRKEMTVERCESRNDDGDAPINVLTAFTCTMNRLSLEGRRQFNQNFDDALDEENYGSTSLSPENVDAILRALEGEDIPEKARDLVTKIHNGRCGLDCNCTKVPEDLADLVIMLMGELPSPLRSRTQGQVLLKNTASRLSS